MSPLLINIGCGSTWHPDWVNLDVHPMDPKVHQWDAGKGLPFEDGQAEVCYASHVLEHFTSDQAKGLLQECRRVLRPGGVIRLAVPDLERIAREYLLALERAESGDQAGSQQHTWMTLELLDQLVRDQSGGEMERYLRTQAHSNIDYVTARIGAGARMYMDPVSEGISRSHPSGVTASAHIPDRTMMKKVVGKVRSVVARAVESMINGDLEALRVGRFRLSGECHRWMYDRFSLRQLLEQTGFTKIQVCTAFDSRIDRFSSFDLDVVNGRVRKPDSLFMEAVKPEGWSSTATD